METVYLWRKDSFLLPGVTRHSLPFTYDFFSPVSFLTFLCQVLIEGEVCIYPPTGLPSVSESSETQTSSWSPTWHGQVLCALCSSLQPLAAWNSLISQEKWADLRCPTQDVPWTEFRCWDVLFSVQVTTKQVQGHVYVTSSTGTSHVLWSVLTHPLKAVFVFWTQELNLRTAEATGVSKECWFPSHLLLWKSLKKSQVHPKYLLLSVKLWLIINIRNAKGSCTH